MGVLRAQHGVDGVLGALVGTNEAECERRATVVGTGDVGTERGMRDHADVLRVDTERRERVAPSLGVDDDTIDA